MFTESNRVEDRWILISKFYVDSKKVSKKFLHCHYLALQNHPLNTTPKNDFSFLWALKIGFGEKKIQYRVVTVEELFAYIFGIYIKFG